MSSNEFMAVPEIIETKDDEGNDTTDWRAIAMAQNEAAKANAGVGKRNYSDLQKREAEIAELKKAKEPGGGNYKPQQKGGVDYGVLTFLEVKGISEEEDQDWFLEEAKNTGKEPKELWKYKYVQEELKARKDARNVEEATPRGSKRSSGGNAGTPEYYLSKVERGEINILDVPEGELRNKVLDLREKSAKTGRRFSNTPVIG